jgi:exopolysaccharide production protein ExoY
MAFFLGGRSGPVAFRRERPPSAAKVVKLLLPDVARLPASGMAGFERRTAPALARDRGAEPLGGRPKRLVDVVLATAMLIALSPIMLIVAALIRVFMGGSVIFSQRRLGFNRSVFVCYKFRTMAPNAEELLRRHLAADPQAAREWRETRKLRNDPRINCLGRILRKSSLDELPQLFNVLRGEMSLIGPRPIVPDEVACYGRHAPVYFSARPGLTGVWQTCGRNRVSYAARVARDRYYVRNWSLRLDLIVLLKTIPAVLNFDHTS